MSFRVIEKRDDGTTIAILDNSSNNSPQNEPENKKKATKENYRSYRCYPHKFLAKNENEKRNLIVKPNQRDTKSNNSQENQKNKNLNSSTSQTVKKVNNLQIEQAISKTTNLLTKFSNSSRAINDKNKKPVDRILNTTRTNIDSNKKQVEQIDKNINTKKIIEDSYKKQVEQIITNPNKEQTKVDSNKEQTKVDSNKGQTKVDSNKEQVEQNDKTQTVVTDTKFSATIPSSPKRNTNPRLRVFSSYYTKRKLLPPRLLSQENQITLVLDLDETLVHSVFCPISHCDFSFRTDPLHFISVCIRPGVKDFILQVGNLYELVLFTVGNNVYADRIIDFIDPQHMIKYRLYRDSCTYLHGDFIKDLSRLGRDLNKVIILDDSPLAYKFQPKNALPISSWIDDPNDDELIRIQNFLIENHDVNNVYDVLNEYKEKYLNIRHRRRRRHYALKRKEDI